METNPGVQSVKLTAGGKSSCILWKCKTLSNLDVPYMRRPSSEFLGGVKCEGDRRLAKFEDVKGERKWVIDETVTTLVDGEALIFEVRRFTKWK